MISVFLHAGQARQVNANAPVVRSMNAEICQYFLSDYNDIHS